MGQLAVSKSSNPQVKQFAQRMIDDHGKADNQLQSVASKDDISLPAAMTSHEKLIYDNLSKLSGSSFDHAYMYDMVKDHQADVNTFQMEARNGSNADMKSFAGTTLPTLQEHLRLARQTNDALPGSR
jgi:putative membrane protein